MRISIYLGLCAAVVACKTHELEPSLGVSYGNASSSFWDGRDARAWGDHDWWGADLRFTLVPIRRQVEYLPYHYSQLSMVANTRHPEGGGTTVITPPAGDGKPEGETTGDIIETGGETADRLGLEGLVLALVLCVALICGTVFLLVRNRRAEAASA